MKKMTKAAALKKVEASAADRKMDKVEGSAADRKMDNKMAMKMMRGKK